MKTGTAEVPVLGSIMGLQVEKMGGRIVCQLLL
jgi:hypothetical protein